MLKRITVSRNEIEEILRNETLGFLGMCKDGIPYVIPISYAYIDSKILFHCALKGKKLDFLRNNPQVCFTTGRQTGKMIRHPQGASCEEDQDSVVCYGMARIVEDINERCTLLNIFNRCFRPNTREILTEEVTGCYAVEISISKMTGRQRRKRVEYTYWEYSFIS